MNPVIFIDPGYGKEWEFTGGKRINSDGKPANPYARVSFRGENCTAFCTNLDVNLALTSLTNREAGYQLQCNLKFSVYCTDMVSGGEFSMGFTQDKTQSAPDYFGVKINSAGSYTITIPPDVIIRTSPASNKISKGYHNISLMLYVSRTATNAYTHAYRIAIDDGVLYCEKSDTAAIPVLYLGAWFPPAEFGRFFISNVIFSMTGGESSKEICDKKVIPPNTQLMPLKLGEPEDITFEKSSDKEGEYIGYVKGDKLLQTIDATNLINGTETTKSYGEGAKVDTVVVYGNPAYKTADFNKIVHGVFDGDLKLGYAYVSASTDATYTIDLMTGDTTLGDINGKQAGWQIGNERGGG